MLEETIDAMDLRTVVVLGAVSITVAVVTHFAKNRIKYGNFRGRETDIWIQKEVAS